MSAVTEPLRRGRRSRTGGRGLAWLARAGFVARGLNYGLIGVLALQLAWSDRSSHAANQQGALETVVQQPLGHVLLVLVAVGLAGYSAWRFVRAAGFVGPEGGREDSLLDQVVAGGSGFFYGGLCALAVSILVGHSHGSGNAHHTAAGVLGWPAGRYLVAFAGVVLLVVAVGQIWKAASTDFVDDEKTEEMSTLVRRWLVAIGVLGYLARMVVFGLIGYFLLDAAIDFDPKKAVGVDGALRRVQHAPYGPALLTVVAVGLIVFALYSFSDARFRRL
jgi:hypothetical protein